MTDIKMRSRLIGGPQKGTRKLNAQSVCLIYPKD